MDYIHKVIQELLMEEVQQDKVSYAIKKRHEVSFIYDSGDGDSRGKRERITVQPVAYGLTSAGNPCFRAYQLNGSSESAEKKEGQIPGWRLFLLDKVKPNSWKDSGKKFNKPPQYNEKGDKTMSQVLVQADFEGTSTRYEKGGLKKYNDERHTRNVENNPFYDLQKQIKKKKIAPDFVMKNIKDTEKTPYEREREWQLANNERLRGNQQSIADMSRQKDFGNDEEQQTIGPQRKGQGEQTVNKSNRPNNYTQALQNGPRFKGQENINNQDGTEENDINNGYRQRIGASTENDA